MKFPPELVEWIPALGGLLAAGLGWAAALYTRHIAHPRNKDTPAE